MFVLLVILLFFNYCYGYHLSNAVSHHKSVLLRHKRLLSINMIPTEVLCDENFLLELAKIIVQGTVPIAVAGFLFNSIKESTKSQVDGIKELIATIEKSTKLQVDGIKESTKSQVAIIEKQIATTEKSTKLQVDSIEKQIATIEKLLKNQPKRKLIVLKNKKQLLKKNRIR